MYAMAVPLEHKEKISGFIDEAVSKGAMKIIQPLRFDIDGWSFIFNGSPILSNEDWLSYETGVSAVFVDTRTNKWSSGGVDVANHADVLVIERFYFSPQGTYNYKKPFNYLEDGGLFDSIVAVERNRLPQRIKDNPGYAEVYAVAKAGIETIPGNQNQFEYGRLYLMRRLLQGE